MRKLYIGILETADGVRVGTIDVVICDEVIGIEVEVTCVVGIDVWTRRPIVGVVVTAATCKRYEKIL